MTNSSLPSAPAAQTAEPRYTSWGADSDARWNLFRGAVQSGLHADQAADLAGIERIPAAPKVEFEW